MARRFTKDIPLLALLDILPQDRATVADVTRFQRQRAGSRDAEIRLALMSRIAAGLVRGRERREREIRERAFITDTPARNSLASITTAHRSAAASSPSAARLARNVKHFFTI